MNGHELGSIVGMPKRRSDPQVNESEVAERLARLDRGPIQEVMARVVAAMPSLQDQQDYYKDHPYQHARAVALMARPAGYVDRSEALTLNMSADTVARELVNRLGADKARERLAEHGLPISLVDQYEPAAGVTVDQE